MKIKLLRAWVQMIVLVGWLGIGFGCAELSSDKSSTGSVVAKEQPTGPELYSINCNRCHQERYPTERTAAAWKTIMLHMQVRANIPVSQAKLILQYLQENSGR